MAKVLWDGGLLTKCKDNEQQELERGRQKICKKEVREIRALREVRVKGVMRTAGSEKWTILRNWLKSVWLQTSED